MVEATCIMQESAGDLRVYLCFTVRVFLYL